MPVPTIAPASGIYGPQVTFRTQAIFPPEAEYVSRDDVIRLDVRNPAFPDTITMSLRFLGPDGVIVSETYQFSVASVGANPQVILTSHAEGFILSATLTGTAPGRGLVFAQLSLQRGGPSAPVTLGRNLVQGYVTMDDDLSYPGSVAESSQSGRGNSTVIVIPGPGAGVNFSTFVPTGQRWKLKGMTINFNSDAVAGNRGLVLAVGTGSNLVIPQAPLIPANTTASVTWAEAIDAVTLTAGGVLFTSAALPADLMLPAGAQILAVAQSLDPGDSWGAASLFIEQFVGR